jgi:predicted ferric reductase
MQPGDRMEMREPLGMFVLRQPPRDSIFIATGTGIAPFRSFLQAHLNESSPAFTLLFGVRYESHLLYREEFEEMARRGGLDTVEAAFLEGGKPDLAGALEAMADKVSRVVVVPYFLTLGLHLQRDLPRLIEKVKTAHPGLAIEVTPPLDQHPAMVEALLDRAKEAAWKQS